VFADGALAGGGGSGLHGDRSGEHRFVFGFLVFFFSRLSVHTIGVREQEAAVLACLAGCLLKAEGSGDVKIGGKVRDVRSCVLRAV
jgi:hypothetical protein